MESTRKARQLFGPHAIYALRQKMRWTQKVLAEHVGVHRVTVTRWESGATEPSDLAREKLWQIANYLNEAGYEKGSPKRHPGGRRRY